VLVTRAAEDAAPWAERLAALGANPVVFPCLVCETLDDAPTRAALAAALDGAAWLALTSRRGVEAVGALAPGGVPDGVAIAAVGPATAEAARVRFGRCELVAPKGTGTSLAEALRHALAARPSGAARPKVAIAAADRAEPHLERVLIPAGIAVARVDVYRTVPAPPETPRVALDALGIDTILLASPSAVAGLLHRAVVPGGAVVVTIGPSTTEAARAHGLAVLAEARRPGLDGILEVIP
jgi:uroporphyrinogen-III synthase